MKTKVIVIVGATAVGKTALSVELAQRFDGEIISGDSQQVYRGLDIGTAKASKREQDVVPHHLIDIREVTEQYSAYDFVCEAKKAIAAISRRHRLPIIVGGTGLYIQSLLEGYHLGGHVSHEEIVAYRDKLECLSDQELFEKVAKQAIQIPQLNRRRAIRQLELAYFGNELKNEDSQLDPCVIGLNDERPVLYERINDRVDKMVLSGVLDEARWLYEQYPMAPAAKGIGYKEFFPYFAGNASKEEAIAQVKQQTRRFAKRQLTWFRNRMNLSFYTSSQLGWKKKVFERVEAFLAGKK